ncbi:MAG: hypothetical protein QOE52_1198 [Mycobacterium sp.]|nr:hypothetical protein [Mycobacterium sp.]
MATAQRNERKVADLTGPGITDRGWVLGFFEHGDYLGLPESAIQAAMNDTATTVIDGLTTSS